MPPEVILRLATIKDLPALERLGARLFDHEIKRHGAEEFLADPRYHLVLAGIKIISSGWHQV